MMPDRSLCRIEIEYDAELFDEIEALVDTVMALAAGVNGRVPGPYDDHVTVSATLVAPKESR